MGAETFWVVGKGETAREAFIACVEDARYEEGNGGYTGTIAEKSRFVMITVPEGKDPKQFAGNLLDDCDPRIDDKWGPAGCVALGEGEWLFFGWASS